MDWYVPTPKSTVLYFNSRIGNIAGYDNEATINPNAHLIKGKICGYKVEEIQTPLTQQARYLDKLVDELAKGHKMEKILRSE